MSDDFSIPGWRRWRPGEWNAFCLHLLDQQLPEAKKLYLAHDPDERAAIRSWVEKVAALFEAGKDWGLTIKIHAQYDEFDDDGVQIDAGDATLSPVELLNAIAAWDAGDDYAPERASS